MFSRQVRLKLYVDDVQAERLFWSQLGFVINNIQELMGYETFEMKPDQESNLTFTVYAKDFIKEVSPEVVDMAPSVLFETEALEDLHEKISQLTEMVSPIQQEPFPNFNFASPSGLYFAVRGN